MDRESEQQVSQFFFPKNSFPLVFLRPGDLIPYEYGFSFLSLSLSLSLSLIHFHAKFEDWLMELLVNTTFGPFFLFHFVFFQVWHCGSPSIRSINQSTDIDIHFLSQMNIRLYCRRDAWPRSKYVSWIEPWTSLDSFDHFPSLPNAAGFFSPLHLVRGI